LHRIQSTDQPQYSVFTITRLYCNLNSHNYV